ncbi:MAG: phosphate transport system permease protein, partial [Abditibacteriota bacterium]|nr:phosphate transport system permease protein [Abditibacteriota bacterium]
RLQALRPAQHALIAVEFQMGVEPQTSLSTSPVTAQMPVGGELSAPAIVEATGTSSRAPAQSTLTGRKRPLETFLFWLFAACASVSVFTTFGIIFVLVEESLPFFQHVPLSEFLLGREWTPQFEPARFGIQPLVRGTLLVTAGAALFSLPLGLLSAIYLSEYASPRARNILKPLLELLAGVPSIVYGYFALVYITPLLQKAATVLAPTATPVLAKLTGDPDFVLEVGVFNALSASIAIAIMTLPLVSSLCEDALHVVPRALREGAYALGATKMEVSTQVVIPAALSGIAASFILAISRSVGETMVVALAAGATPSMTTNPLESVQTMTGYIANISMGDVEHGTISYQTIFAVGVVLFLMTVTMNLISIGLVKKYRQKYD